MVDYTNLNLTARHDVQDILDDYGLGTAEISEYTDRHDNTIVRFETYINGERYVWEEKISNHRLLEAEQSSNMSVETVVRNAVERSARGAERQLTDTMRWQDRRVVFDVVRGCSVECMLCGATASLDELQEESPLVLESSTPNRAAVSNSDPFEEISTHKIRLALLALLKGECDASCPNGFGDDLF